MVDRNFWRQKKVFLTGHTGFKGGWLATWLLDMDSQLFGYALKPDTVPSFFLLCGLEDRMLSIIGDVREGEAVSDALGRVEPEIIIHLAAQPLVRRSYQAPIETFLTNVIGTVNVLDAVRQIPSVRAVVIVTSDKCYENKDQTSGYREDDAIGGHDPYSASKGCAELATAAYRRSFFEGTEQPVGVATVRAGNVIGGGDWAEDRLFPDTVRALDRGEQLVVRKPGAIRPWQHVLEPLAGYLMLAERLYNEGGKWGGGWNFSPRDEDAVTVAALSDMIIRQWGKGCWKSASKQDSFHEAHDLKLDSSKARQVLGWCPSLSLQEAVEMTVVWYQKALLVNDSRAMYDVTCDQIRGYEARWVAAHGDEHRKTSMSRL